MSGLIRKFRPKGKIFPKCLPSQDDLQAVYLGKVAPSSSGIVTDESGVSGDAQLVDSYCGTYDGGTTAIGSTAPIHDGSHIPFDIWFNNNDISGTETFGGKGIISGNQLEVIIRLVNGRPYFYFTEFGTSASSESYVVPLVASAGQWHNLKGQFLNGELTGSLDGIAFSQTFGFTTVFQGSAPFQTGAWNGALKTEPLSAKMALCKIGNMEIAHAEGDNLFLWDRVAGSYLDITGTAVGFWDNLQDVFHQNAANGFKEITDQPVAMLTETGETFQSPNLDDFLLNT